VTLVEGETYSCTIFNTEGPLVLLFCVTVNDHSWGVNEMRLREAKR